MESLAKQQYPGPFHIILVDDHSEDGTAAIARGNYNSNTGFTGRTTTYDVVVAATMPLYDRGQRYAALREDQARLAQAYRTPPDVVQRMRELHRHLMQ